MTIEMLATKGVQGLTPYLPGKPVSELERELGITNITKLASNENPLPWPESVRKAIEAELCEGTRYPDGGGFALKSKLADKFSIQTNQITLGNGSNDILEMIGRVFTNPGESIMYSQYAFAVYPITAQVVGANPIEVPAKDWGHDLQAMADSVTDDTKVIYIANPNNPTGTFIPGNEIYDLLKQIPNRVIVVLDEAYTEYLSADEAYNSFDWLNEFENLIITRTFSKAYGLASLRVGFAVSSVEIAGLLNRIRQPFNVNSMALAAATAVLDDAEYLRKGVEINTSGMEQIVAGLEAFDFEPIPSKANFVCVDMKQSGPELYQKLLHKGVIVRPVANYGLPNHLRISIGTHSENAAFVMALTEVL